MTAVVELQRSQVLASRAYGHGLGARQPSTAQTIAASAAGIRLTRNTALSFAARVHPVSPNTAERGGRGTLPANGSPPGRGSL